MDLLLMFNTVSFPPNGIPDVQGVFYFYLLYYNGLKKKNTKITMFIYTIFILQVYNFNSM